MNTLYLAHCFVATIGSFIASEGQPSASPSKATASDWGYLIETSFHKGVLHLTVGPIALAFGVIVFLMRLAWWSRRGGWGAGDYEIVETELGFGELGKVKIVPQHDTRRIAYQAWVELSTRKIGLPFDPDHDVILEVYDSWHKAFGEIRTLAKSIPAERVERSADTRKLVVLMVAVLNKGLRPHLTRWQAEFRRWYAHAEGLPHNATRSPQSIQREFGQYAALADDLKRIQLEMVKYRKFLWDLATGEKESLRGKLV